LPILLMPTRSFTLTASTNSEDAVTALARISELPKARLKDALNKGAVWLKRGSKQKRLRRATFLLLPGDTLTLHYNAEVLARIPPAPELLADERDYSVWIKPAGLLAQGSPEGDHCSLLRQAELLLKRESFLVHRLDREAAGLMLVAHTSKAAAALSVLFARQDANAGLRKEYLVEVLGEVPAEGEIAQPLDDKAALTRYRRIATDPARNSSRVEVELVTGRKHQIRRHFAAIDHPVLGDPQYGSGNKDGRGLQLFAVALKFTCPLRGQARCYRCQPDADS